MSEKSRQQDLIICANWGVIDSFPDAQSMKGFEASRRTLYPPKARNTKSFEFESYAGSRFARLREIRGLKATEFTDSFGIPSGKEEGLVSSFSAGRSGSFFYRTHDQRFVIKTVTPKEKELLLNILDPYIAHLEVNPASLMCRFLGLYGIKIGKAHKFTYFVVMENVFGKANLRLHEFYDLKGSHVARQAIKKGMDASKFQGTRKDMDLKRPLGVGTQFKAAVVAQMVSDVTFLNSVNVMDYSLLVGIHNCEPDGSCCVERKPTEPAHDDPDLHPYDILISGVRGIGPPVDPTETFDPAVDPPESDRESVYFFGIIDMLQLFDRKKVAEHHLKSKVLLRDAKGISAVNADEYAKRFLDKLIKHFV